MFGWIWKWFLGGAGDGVVVTPGGGVCGDAELGTALIGSAYLKLSAKGAAGSEPVVNGSAYVKVC